MTLTHFLEKGGQLVDLTHRQFDEIEYHFIQYLIHGESFNAAYAACVNLLEPDQLRLSKVIRERLGAMIEDHRCNVVIKPAILRMIISGDLSGFEEANYPVARTRSILYNKSGKLHRDFAGCARRVVLSPVDITQSKCRAMEIEYLKAVNRHIKRFAYSRMRFLTIVGQECDLLDIENDLNVLAFRAFRWYFPFRDGLHMQNTMRRTVTNRGRGLITTAVRNKLLAVEGSNHVSIEQGVDMNVYANSIEHSVDSKAHLSEMLIDIDRLTDDGRLAHRLVRFVVDPTKQDELVDFMNERMGKRFTDFTEMTAYIQKHRLSYPKLLASFLKTSPQEIDNVLARMRAVV